MFPKNLHRYKGFLSYNCITHLTKNTKALPLSIPASQIGEPMPTHAAPVANGNAEAAPAPAPEAQPEAPAAPAPPSPKEEAKPAPVAEPAKAEAPKRVRVPPGGFSSGLW